MDWQAMNGWMMLGDIPMRSYVSEKSQLNPASAGGRSFWRPSRSWQYDLQCGDSVLVPQSLPQFLYPGLFAIPQHARLINVFPPQGRGRMAASLSTNSE